METNIIKRKRQSHKKRVSAFREKLSEMPFAAIWTIVIAGWGIYQYSDQSDRDLRKALFTEQVQTYKDLSSCASELAAWNNDSVNNNAFQSKRIQFRQLMIGKATIFQDVSVEKEAKKFWRLLDRYTPNSIEIQQEDLINSAIRISFAERNALQTIWGKKIPEMERLVNPDSASIWHKWFQK